MQTHALTFDAATELDRFHFKHCYIAWNRFAAASVEGPPDRGLVAIAFNAALLEKLDAISTPTNKAEGWPGMTMEMHGFTARELHDGPQTVTLSPVQLKRLFAAVELLSAQVDVVMQGRFFRPLIVKLAAAQENA